MELLGYLLFYLKSVLFTNTRVVRITYDISYRDSCLSSNPVTKTPNRNQLEDSLSISTLRTKRRTYPKERLAEVTRSKKAAKKSNKPKGFQKKVKGNMHKENY